MNHDIGNVTIRVSRTTKAALNIFAAKEYAKTGRSLTNDQAIMKLLEIVDNDAVKQIVELSGTEVHLRADDDN